MMKRTLTILLALAVMVSMLTGCGSGGAKAEANYDYAADMEMNRVWETSPAMEAGKETGSLTSNSQLDSTANADRKLIKTVTLHAETEGYDDLIDHLTQTINELGGYVQNREVSGSRRRSLSMTIRIPADRLDQFVEQVQENANVTSSSETADDVTLQYVDTEAKVKALETEQARLLELLAGAQNLSEILEIEARLSDVTYELERYASQLRTLANLVSYATVHLYLREVEVLTPVEEPTVWQRITTGFGESLEGLGEDLTNLFVWIVVESPYLVFWGAVIVLAVFLRRRFRKTKTGNAKKFRWKKRKNSAEPPSEA